MGKGEIMDRYKVLKNIGSGIKFKGKFWHKGDIIETEYCKEVDWLTTWNYVKKL